MRPILISGPAFEPLSLAEARLWLRYDTTFEDSAMALLMTAVRQAVESASRCHLVTQRWRLVADAWPKGLVVPLPMNPVQSIDAVRIYDSAGVASLLPAQRYRLSRSNLFARLKFDAPPPAPGIFANGIEIDLTTGFSSNVNDIPGPLRQAMRLLLARWFDNRGDQEMGRMPPDVLALIAPYRRMRLG
jgi:uncharacterized phiE125 gp8 family phage protein